MIINALIFISAFIFVWLFGFYKNRTIFWTALFSFWCAFVLLTVYGLDIIGGLLDKKVIGTAYIFWTLVIVAGIDLLLLKGKIKSFKEVVGNLKLSKGLIFLLAAFLGVLLFSLQVPEFSGDGLMYQLPVVGQWMQGVSIYEKVELSYYWRNNIWAFYPNIVQILYFWIAKTISSAQYFKILHFVFLSFLSITTYYFTKEKGWKFNLLAPIMILTTPVILNLFQTGLIDIEFSAFLFFSLICVYYYLTTERFRYLILSAVLNGILLGIKLNGFLAAFFLFLSLFLVVIANYFVSRRNANWKNLSLYGIFSGIFYIIFSAPYFYRNLANGKEILYPLGLLASFKETFLSDFGIWFKFLFFYDSSEMSSGINMYNYDAGIGILAASLGLSAIIFLITWVYNNKKELNYSIFFLIPIFLAAFLFYKERPAYLMVRHFIFLIPISAVFSTFLLSEIKAKKFHIYFLLFILLAFNFILAVPPSFNFTNFAFKKEFYKDLFMRRINSYEQRGDLTLQNYKKEWEFMDSLTLKNPSNILPVHQIFTYNLHGSKMQNKVFNFAEIEKPLFLEKIKANNINYIFLSKLNNVDFNGIKRIGSEIFFETDNVNTDEMSIFYDVNKIIRQIELDYELLDFENAKYYLGINDFKKAFELANNGNLKYILPNNEYIYNLGILVLDRPITKVNKAKIGINILKLKLDGETVKPQWELAHYPLVYRWVSADPDKFKEIYKTNEVYIYKIQK